MEATLPLLVPRESPSDVETLDQLRELLLSEDEVKLVVLECFHGGQNAASSLSPIKPVPFTQRAELARAYPSLSIHHVALTGAEGKSIEHALRCHVAPRCIVCAGGPQPRALVRRQVSNQEK
ncbi:uncharacterized protein RHOBADRAFT_46744 [Rhodotorula graminis WP1]|uniref:Uncharacterized protein n=1 Tax=Rhodotorula graminis (strain WP1) TaxID=578459 RepID=A0A0P9ITH3_RHOGW|nr:uncharacterized protein RHOBADRAFT_46744 [Rhodotorula graminis WP1]KPV72698.1 hypothetical protein RHOBADRAFT_46744 [Rhodotorula graminis WP1]